MGTSNLFKKLGFKVNPHIQLVSSIEEAIHIHRKWESERKQLEYEIDGLVIKLNFLTDRSRLGTTSKSPVGQLRTNSKQQPS